MALNKIKNTSALPSDKTTDFEAQFHLEGGRAVFALCFCSTQHMLGGSGSKLWHKPATTGRA